ncbi:lamin tail domain-containing protein [Chromatium okenii]|uniref:lamin tail domain-containing protein n=1 Tax=Chromatium okenii TaxID=61644 RepID=UPI0011B0D935|nr:lamin tail domain-containing protein [Chromatium okenii]
MTHLKMIVLSAITILCVNSVYATPIVFINEIHYDNTGIDTNEFVEITGIEGTDLTGCCCCFITAMIVSNMTLTPSLHQISLPIKATVLWG